MTISLDKHNSGSFGLKILSNKHSSFFFRRPENVRRHVAAASNRPVQSAINKQTRPLQKTTSVQRKSRPTTSTNNNPPRSSSANNNNNPPLRLAPASPLFRNRLK